MTVNGHNGQHIRQTVNDHDAQQVRQTDNDHDAQRIRQMYSQNALSTLDTQCTLNWIESSLSTSTLNVHSPSPDPI